MANTQSPTAEVRICYNIDWDEFTVKLEGNPKADYFTSDAQDALDQAMFNVNTHGYTLVIASNARSRIAKLSK